MGFLLGSLTSWPGVTSTPGSLFLPGPPLPGKKNMAAQHCEDSLRNSIFSIGVSKGPRSIPVRKGTACAVKTEGSTRVHLVTSREVVDGVVEQGGELRFTRFCPRPPDFEDEHLLKDTLNPRYVEKSCFIPLQTTPEYFLKLVSTKNLRKRETRERLVQCNCLSYTFSGNAFKTLTWEFNEEKKTHELTKVDPKGDLDTSACRGSPVVSTQDEDRSVIGVVDCTSDGDLYLCFFNETFEIEGKDGHAMETSLYCYESLLLF